MTGEGFTVNQEQESGGMFELDRKLWLTQDRERVVEDGHAEAAFLLGGPGDEIAADEAERLGLKQAKQAANKQAVEPDNKAIAPAESKKPRSRKRA